MKQIYLKRMMAGMAFLSFIGASPLCAEGVNALLVWTKDGKSVGYELQHAPRATFSENTIDLFADGVTVSYPLEDYLRFVTAPERYLTERMEPVVDSGYDYPVAQLADIRLYLVHYASIAEAQAAWDRRAARLDLTHAWYILNDRNEFTEEHLARFDALPLEHKVCFVHRRDWADRYASAYYIRGFEQQDEVGIMTAFPGKINIRRNVDQFDYVSWFNSGQWKNRS